MRDYRLELFDASSKAWTAFGFPAESDRDAVRLSQQAAAGGPASLWCDATLLLRLDAFAATDGAAAAGWVPAAGT
jgi:hypothetical protein